MVLLSRSLAVVVVFALAACGGKKPDPVPEPATTAPEKKPDPPKAETKATEPAAVADAAAPADKPDAAAPAPTADAAEAKTDSGFPATVTDALTTLVTATPGTVVRTPVPDSPEWLVQQVLVAAMEPDEEKGWQIFLSLLAEDQKTENALVSRRQLNYPASRRKVKLFLFEDPTKPIYKVDRVVEETPKQVRIFVHNNSEDGMPTPCELRYDDTLKKWRVGICSL